MGKKKKIISLIVSVAMLVAMFPMIVHADGPFTFADLQAQLEASGGDLVSLQESCIATDVATIVVPTGADWKINLNGKTIAGNYQRVFLVESGASLTLMNNVFYPDGTLSSIVSGFADNGGAVYVEENGALSLNPGIAFQGNGAQNGGAIYCERTIEINDDVSVSGNYITGGKGTDIYLAEGGTFELRGDATIGNVYLAKDTVINMTGSCTKSSIGIETEVKPTASKPVTFATGASYGLTSIFSCDGDYIIAQENDEYILKVEGGVNVTLPSITGCSIVLDGRIGLNVFIDPGTYSADDLAGCRMIFDVGNRETDPVAVETDDTTGVLRYKFRCDLSSAEMGCTVGCLLKNGDDETLDQEPLSIESYLATITAQPSGVERAFVNFAHYMWAYLKSIHTTGEYAWEYEYPQISAVYDNICDGYTTNYDAVIAKCEAAGIKKASKIGVGQDAGSGVTKVTFQLEFETTNAFMVYFYVDSGYTENSIPVTVNGVNKRAYKVDNGKYRVRINDICYQYLDTEYVITGNCGGTEDFTVTASPMSYVYTALSNSASSAAKKDAMVSVYWLWKLTGEFNSQGGN